MHPEQNRRPELPQEEKNVELLRNSELGVILARAYLDAMNTDSRLANIAIVPIVDANDQRHAFARPSWKPDNQTAKHEIHIRLDNLDDTLDFFADAMKISSNTNKIAQTLGIQPGEVTPQLLYVHSMLHEMGHTLEYFDYEEQGKTPEDHKHDQKVARMVLPVGGVVASTLLTEGHPNREAIVEQWDAVAPHASKRYSDFKHADVSISTMAELVDATADVYRDTTFEHAADRFAASVLEFQPTMMTQLTGNIDKYRNYPTATSLPPAA